MNVQKLKESMEVLKENLGSGLIAADIYGARDGQTIIALDDKPQPVADALFAKIINMMQAALKEAKFPALDRYFLMSLEGDISGIVFDDKTPLISSLSQGCTPIGEVHQLTQCEHHIAIEIDKRPALDVFKDEIGEVLSRDIDSAAGYIFVAFPIKGHDTANYLVRDIIGIDVENRHLAIADNMKADSAIMFCKRDGQSAIEDMHRMLNDIKKRADGKQIKGAIYISCLGRGKNLFGDNSEELKMITEVLGDIPIAGFYANGEIAANQLYGYTGVLTVFLDSTL